MDTQEHHFHLLVVDDDKRIRQLLGAYLKEHGFYVSLAADALEARKLMQKYQFNMLIVDVMMPGETGIEFTASIRKSSNVPILMLTAMGESQDRITGLESGADDYLPKPFEPKELLLRLQNILQRITPQDQATELYFGHCSFNLQTARLTKQGNDITLTTNEENLLKIFCLTPDTIISREDLALACGGINERSVDVQITRLRNKIEPEPKSPHYLKSIRGKGYILRTD